MVDDFSPKPIQKDIEVDELYTLTPVNGWYKHVTLLVDITGSSTVSVSDAANGTILDSASGASDRIVLQFIDEKGTSPLPLTVTHTGGTVNNIRLIVTHGRITGLDIGIGD